MPSWFKKVFKEDRGKPKAISTRYLKTTVESPEPAPRAAERPVTRESAPPPDVQHDEDRPKIRKIINAPVIMPEEEQSGWSEDIRIKARVERDGMACVFMVDRPVLEGLSAWLPDPEWASDVSPLAVKLFQVDGVGSVLLHEMTVTLTRKATSDRSWEDIAKDVGAVIREHLKNGEKVVTDKFLESLPPEEEIRQRVQACVDLEINPGIAAHSGVVSLERVEGNSVYITMGGGCQGCAASAITLRQGIHAAFRRAVPSIGGIFDETDHTAGKNPYFKDLPPEMMQFAEGS